MQAEVLGFRGGGPSALAAGRGPHCGFVASGSASPAEQERHEAGAHDQREYRPAVTGNGAPFPGAPVVEGTWVTIGDGHVLIPLSTDRVLDWQLGSDSGHYGFGPTTHRHRQWRPTPRDMRALVGRDRDKVWEAAGQQG
jgi:hypothetical protein